MILAVVPTLLLAALVSCSVAYYDPPLLEALAAPSPDHETSSYLLPRLSAKYRPHGDWENAPDPRFYVLTELERESSQAARRVKRTGSGPSLSIVNPLDVLRQRLLLEIARRRMRQSQDQIQANREILQTIGKREVNTSQQDLADDAESEFVISSTEEKSGNVSPDNDRSPETSDWSAATNSRWNNEFTSQHHS
ncbi:diuretic hormone 1 [Periplaneta americana]